MIKLHYENTAEVKGRDKIYFVRQSDHSTKIKTGMVVQIDNEYFTILEIELIEKNGKIEDRRGVLVTPFKGPYVASTRVISSNSHCLFVVDSVPPERYPIVSLNMPAHLAEFIVQAIEEKMSRES